MFLRLAAGWCTLLIYAAAVSSLGLDLAGVISSFDAGHEVRIKRHAEGIQLVLHHRQSCVTHRHGIAAQMVTLFAVPFPGANPDHILQFGGGASHCLSGKGSAPMPPVIFQFFTTSPTTHVVSAVFRAFHGLKASSGFAPGLGLRSTVLLI